MSNTQKVLFKYNNKEIESAYIFEDGDFIIFDIKYHSPLYDGKTLKEKLFLKVASESCFFDLKNNEFGLCINYEYTINIFNKGRTEYKEIQKIYLQQFESGIALMRLLNGDIIFSKFYMGSQAFSVYRKKSDKIEYDRPEIDPYQYQSKYRIENCEEILELNKNEFLIYKRTFCIPESLLLTIYDNKNYKCTRRKKIVAEFKENDKIKKKIYFTTKIMKYNDEKLITSGCSKIYIIGLKLLELETTINLEQTISQMIIRPKGNLLVLTYLRLIPNKDEKKQKNPIVYKYFMHNIKIDFATNDMIKNEVNDISDKVGSYSSFYKFCNYLHNGLVVNTDNELIIYEDYGD